jgi:hypothetical protein
MRRVCVLLPPTMYLFDIGLQARKIIRETLRCYPKHANVRCRDDRTRGLQKNGGRNAFYSPETWWTLYGIAILGDWDAVERENRHIPPGRHIALNRGNNESYRFPEQHLMQLASPWAAPSQIESCCNPTPLLHKTGKRCPIRICGAGQNLLRMSSSSAQKNMAQEMP